MGTGISAASGWIPAIPRYRVSHPSGNLFRAVLYASFCCMVFCALTHVTQQKAFVRLRLQLFRFPASAELLSGPSKGRTFLAAW